jgi:3-oxoacyl-(acyl-carrier-protein) synthase
VGVIEGTSVGPLAEVLATERQRARAEHHSPPRADYLLRMMFGAGGAVFAQEIGAHGPVYAVSAGSVSGLVAIEEGYWKILQGLADVIVAGGAECPLDPEIIEVFDAARILAPQRSSGLPCRPFDRDRSGTLLGEGSGMLVLESAAHAGRRGARPRAVLAGVGCSCESYSMVLPDPSGAGVAEAVRQALRGTDPHQLGWIKAHGTGTRRNDIAECRGLEAALDGGLARVPITSLKPLLGHCLGASGSVEAVATVVALERGVVPPTLGTETVDPELPACHVALTPMEAKGSAVLLLSESFGGRCAAITVRH